MSEEKPTFKITDRRLFNNDGSPREDSERQEPSTTATPILTSETAGAPASAKSTQASSPASARASAQSTEPSTDSEATPRTPGENTAEMGDPNPFVNLVMFIAQPAAAALGMTEHPGMNAGDVDLPLGKHCIDLLAVLRQKTQGSLSAQEQQILEGVIAELRMQYVSFAGARPASAASPSGFSGSDITGGR